MLRAAATRASVVTVFASRFTHLTQARARFGDRVDRLGSFLTRVDPLADAVVRAMDEMPAGAGWSVFRRLLEHGAGEVRDAPEAMRALLASVERVPVWVDWPIIDGAGAVLVRAGPLGGIVLGLKSLVSAYTSPGGNKPLVWSGRLQEHAPRRLNETARFVRETILPGGMRPRRAGWRLTLQVRIIHAQVRRMILRTGRWDERAWGAPINQHDEAGTSLLFSVAVLDGLRQLGMTISSAEAEAYLQLWRWSGWLMGIDPELLVTSEREGRALLELIRATQDEPDDDSRALTRALLESPRRGAGDERERRRAERAYQVSVALCRLLVGDEVADRLAIPRTSLRPGVFLVRGVVAGLDRVRRRFALADAQALAAGGRYWDRVVEVGLAGATAELAPPQRLSGVGAEGSPDRADPLQARV